MKSFSFRLIVLLHAYFTAAVDPAEFSRLLSKGSKGDMVPGAGGKAGKVGTGDGGSSKGGSSKGKDKHDLCVYSNPAIEQALFVFYGDGQSGPGDRRGLAQDRLSMSDESSGLRKLYESRALGVVTGPSLYNVIQHALTVNDAFEEVIKYYVDGKLSPSDIFALGEKALSSHPAELQGIVMQNCMMVCDLLFALVLQMKNTCNDKKYWPAYVNAAANLMSGFANGSSMAGMGLNVLECPYNSKTFEDMYGMFLTDSTIKQVDFGNKCMMWSGDGH